ncbi:MAG: hypothetical protein AVDCRST_MAG16-3341, partial [uncultured Frankineae bacterium]
AAGEATSGAASAGEATSAAAAAAVALVVDALLACPLTGLSAAELQQRIVAVVPQAGRLQGWLRAAEAELSVVCGGQLPTEDGQRSVAGWLADVRRDSPSAVGRDLRTSTALRALPVVVDAVLDGVLTPDQAAVLSRLVGRIDHDALVESQGDLVLVAAGRNPADLAVWVRHQIATHCEPALEAEAERGRDRRFLQHSRDADGTLRGRFVIAAEDSETILTVLEPLARKQGLEDTRTAGQRRADALVDVCEQALRHGDLPDHGGARPQLTYVLPADWAAAQAARVTCTDCGPRCPDHDGPRFTDTVAASVPTGLRAAGTGHAGQVAGAVPAEHACAVAAWTGPQTRARIETMLCDARISRVLLDPVGQVQGLQPLRDSVTPRQRRELAARDLGCAVRGCTRPPAMCDAHHLRSRADGGPTDVGNLVLLCRRHHVLWHLGKIGLHHLEVPWHPDARRPVPEWTDELFTSRAGP